MNKLIEKYQKSVGPKVGLEFGVKNKMAQPKIEKVVINMGIGDIKDNRDEQDKAMFEVASIIGQKPSLRLARKSIASFNVREGQPVGISATLRGVRMYDFLSKLFNVVLPRIRDFRGLKRTSFDKNGNYTLGLTEHSVFPEIDLGKITRSRGLEITIVTNAHSPQVSSRLLEEMGMPFAKS